jgi:hypothetical protein
MTERNKYVDAASEKLTDGEMVERVTHPTHSTTEHAAKAGEDRDEQTSQTPEQSP